LKNNLEIKKLLKTLDVFTTLDDDEFQEITSYSNIKSYDENQIVFYEGQSPEYFYCLIEGSTKVYKVDPKGTEIILHNFNAPTLIAEMASIEEFNFPATCVTTSNATFILLDKNRFLDSLKNNKGISFKIIKSLTRKIRSIDGLLNKALIFDATTKVASYISENPQTFKTKTKKIIATELHITPETFSRVLKKMRDLQIIDKQNNIIDKNKLEMLISF